MSLLNSDVKHKKPIILKKTQIEKLKLRPMLKEDVVFDSENVDFLSGEPRALKIVNVLNLLTNCSRTVAISKGKGGELRLDSDCITKLIGHKNYNTVFSALCSVISQELKVRAILALLSVDKEKIVERIHAETQTESNIDTPRKKPINRRQRKLKKPYIITDLKTINESQWHKKIIIQPEHFKQLTNLNSSSSHNAIQSVTKILSTTPDSSTSQSNQTIKFESAIEITSTVSTPEVELYNESVTNESIPQLKGTLFHSENSRDSIGNVSSLSIDTLPDCYNNPLTLLENIDKHTNQYPVKMLDGFEIMLPAKPEDHFHIATKENLKCVAPEHKKRLLLHQAYLDYQYCLTRDEDDHLPIHTAVLSDDIDFLRRQCLVLALRSEDVDVISGNLTPLQMSLYRECSRMTALLLQHGADPQQRGDEERTPLHLAAESRAGHLQALVQHCRLQARKILEADEELWQLDFALKSDEELSKYLLEHMSSRFDNQGNTALMLASKLSIVENVKLLCEITSNVNIKAPNSGNTALYIAVSEACIQANNSGDKSKVSSEFAQTISTLMDSGADPGISNYSGSNVNELLVETGNSQLSMIVANRLTVAKFGENDQPFNTYMIVKDEYGNLRKKPIKDTPKKGTKPKIENIVKADKAIDKTAARKPIIVKDIQIFPPTVVPKKEVIDKSGRNTYLCAFKNFVEPPVQSKTLKRKEASNVRIGKRAKTELIVKK